MISENESVILNLEDDFPPSDRFDVAVIGAGAAGITLARALAASGKRVVLLEAGDDQPQMKSQDPYAGRVTGNPYQPLISTRVRALGGTTNNWGGMCRPLDPIDFESRPEINRRGWPISHHDLRAFEQPTCEILDLRPFGEDAVCADSNGELRDLTFRMSAPTQFGKKYRGELAQSDRITTVLNANLIGFQTGSFASNVEAVRIRNYKSNEQYLIRAKRFVLCCGGIENARILLAANEEHGNRFGNAHGMVGTCFMEHPHIFPARFVITKADYDNDDYGDNDLNDNIRGLALTPDTLRNLKIGNCCLFLLGVTRQPLLDRGPRADLERFIPYSQMAGTGDGELRYFGSGSVIMYGEQLPSRESKLRLDADKDAFGIKRSHLHWALTKAERLAMSELAVRVARYLARANIGRMHLDPWILDEALPCPIELGGHHHMGTTRMALTEQDGVVDANCLVFGTQNLYVCGGSVFSTSGFANPTFTIVQLALRLAQHLGGAADV